jgi:hypothetical protein|mmetsp:Transcript_17629/g.2892  ORF Transcript_17629/g.2892 Transcript_17629/m.2892 type:complete len:84 (+) Transcript_17629:242-493(+)
MLSIYWAVTTLSTVGYGDISAYTQLEMLLSILWMTFGLCFFSFMIGSLSSMLQSIDTKEVVLTNKLATIDEMSAELGLNADTK